MSFINEKVLPEGLTFDDVLLVPAYSEVLPREVSVRTRFSRNISLNVPIVSAAMDTVTEAPLAIALAREGGIGVIHKNMTIAQQAAHVRRVKRAENGMIYDPITISRNETVGDALALMRDNKIGGIPVVEPDMRLVGIVTKNGIVMVDYMNLLIERGAGVFDAVIAGGKSRLRPVLMTSFTTILGMVPLAIGTGAGSETWQPMGIAVIGGLTCSTILTLFIVPALYSVMVNRSQRKERQRIAKLQASHQADNFNK